MAFSVRAQPMRWKTLKTIMLKESTDPLWMPQGCPLGIRDANIIYIFFFPLVISYLASSTNITVQYTMDNICNSTELQRVSYVQLS